MKSLAVVFIVLSVANLIECQVTKPKDILLHLNSHSKNSKLLERRRVQMESDEVQDASEEKNCTGSNEDALSFQDYDTQNENQIQHQGLLQLKQPDSVSGPSELLDNDDISEMIEEYQVDIDSIMEDLELDQDSGEQSEESDETIYDQVEETIGTLDVDLDSDSSETSDDEVLSIDVGSSSDNSVEDAIEDKGLDDQDSSSSESESEDSDFSSDSDVKTPKGVDTDELGVSLDSDESQSSSKDSTNEDSTSTKEEDDSEEEDSSQDIGDPSFGQESANKIISEIASIAQENSDSDKIYFYDLEDIDETFDYSINLADYLEHIDKEDSEYFDDDGTVDDDTLLEGALVDLVIAILNKIDVGDDTVNFLIKSLEDLIDGKYDDDYIDAAQAMYAVDEESCDLIYAWLVNYDVDEITFLTIDSMKTLDNLKIGFDDVYADRKSQQLVVDLEYLDSLQVFLTVLAQGLELVSNSSEYAESVIAKCDSWSQEKYDGKTEDLAEDSYDWDPTRTQYVFAWFLRLDIDDTQVLSSESRHFLNDYFHELMEVYEDEVQSEYEQGEDHAYNLIENKQMQSIFNGQRLALDLLQKQHNLLQTKTKDDYTISWLKIMIQAILFLDNADPNANVILESLDKAVDQYWDGDVYNCAMDCYRTEQNTTNALLLSFSLLDIDEASFLTSQNKDFINDYGSQLRAVYIEEEQKTYDKFIQVKFQSHKAKNGKLKEKKILDSK